MPPKGLGGRNAAPDRIPGLPGSETVFQFQCKACGASRQARLPCEPSDEAYFGSFLRCPVCLKADRGNWALYWLVLAAKLIGLSGLLAIAAALASGFFWLFVPVGIIGLWVDHRRFRRELDLVHTGSVFVDAKGSRTRPLRP